ncbi:MAG: 4-hydroxybenzoate octaprenyltransferase [Endozoicomonas sp.]|uniref:4-hydroxybenzoate octaprenyltransferase n=1 Tax=Endozoicomonas sp. TaxID=1892382 RepID=UPI003D9AEBE9
MQFRKSLGVSAGKEAILQRLPRLKDFLQLARMDRPIGIYLLLWPAMWALWVAAEGLPSLANLVIFSVGVVLMRSAGCVINDFADRKVDGHVKRTQHRPLVTGKIQEKEALIYFAAMVLLAFILVLFTNTLTIQLSFAGLLLASAYPFAKRHTHLPQVVLGAAFGWSIPMAFAAQSTELGSIAWLMFLANLFWTVAYDTQYAMVDRDDDLKVGIKSTAILFGEMDNLIVGSLQVLTLVTLAMVGHQLALGALYYLSLIAVAALFVYQQLLTSNRERDACFKAFLNNHWAGAIVFAGLVVSYL